MSGEELFLFVHLPKTGGQTLRNCFIKHLEFHRTFIHLGPFGEKKAEELGLLPFAQRTPEERAQARVILGHGVNARTHELVPGKIPRYIVFLRDPAELLVSLYNFEMKYARPREPICFNRWYAESNRRNTVNQWFLVHFFGLKEAPGQPGLQAINSALEDFWFVGCSEFLNRDAPLLLRRIGVPPDLERANIGGVNYPKLISLDDSLRKRLVAENELDYELYKYWRERLKESVGRIEAQCQVVRSNALLSE